MPRINIYVSDDALAEIDQCAAAAGENRSEYLVRAAVIRAGDPSVLLSDRVRRAIARALTAFVLTELDV